MVAMGKVYFNFFYYVLFLFRVLTFFVRLCSNSIECNSYSNVIFLFWICYVVILCSSQHWTIFVTKHQSMLKQRKSQRKNSFKLSFVKCTYLLYSPYFSFSLIIFNQVLINLQIFKKETNQYVICNRPIDYTSIT